MSMFLYSKPKHADVVAIYFNENFQHRSADHVLSLCLVGQVRIRALTTA